MPTQTQQGGTLPRPAECKKVLDISKNLKLPRDEISRVEAIFGQRGSGKTYSAGVLQEEEILACGRFIVFDPVRAHRGILYAEGVIGVDQLEIHDAEYWAGEVTRPGNRLSYVFDLAPMGFEDAQAFIDLFCKHALLINKRPIKVYIEEAHLFLPNFTGKGNKNIVRLATVGRQYGWGLTIISQRPAHVNKDVLTQADAIFAMRLMHPLDVEAIYDIWASAMPRDQADKLKEKLPKQEAGQCILFSSEWLEPDFYTANIKKENVFLKQFRFRQKYTPHLASTPKFEPEKDMEEDFKAIEIQPQDLERAEEAGLDVKDPDEVEYVSSQDQEVKNALQEVGLIFLGLLGGYAGGSLVQLDPKVDPVLKMGTGAVISLLSSKEEAQTLEGVGLGLTTQGAEEFLRSQGYLKNKGGDQ